MGKQFGTGLATAGTIAEKLFEFVVRHLGQCLKQQVCAAQAPVNLLQLQESSAANWVDR